MRSLLFILISLVVSSSLAQGLSAVREINESYEQARHRSVVNAIFLGVFELIPEARTTPLDVKVSLQDLKTASIPELPSYEVLENEFKYIRDTRFLTSSDPKFPRRLTWLYPDDGCYARAEMAKRKLIEHKQVSPKKIFVFGNLSAATKNTFSGRVSWWYHVAVTYRVGNDVYVFDPSIEPAHPLTLNEWNLAVGGAQTAVQYAICTANAFDPNSNCHQSKEQSITIVLEEQNSFLRPEWSRLEQLHRNPDQELGDSPPWLN